MNADRRKRLAKAKDMVNKAVSELEAAQAIVTDVRDEEQEMFDNMSQGKQDGEAGDHAQGVISSLDEALTDMENAATNELVNAIQMIENASE